jgi:hypothetical protein
MQKTQKGWVAVGVAALLGLHAMGAEAQRASDTPRALAQQEVALGSAAVSPEKPMTPQSLYEAIAERVHVGGYASFRTRATTLSR